MLWCCGQFAPQRGDLHVFLVEFELDVLIHGVVAGTARSDRAGVAAPQALELGRAPFLELIQGGACRDHIRMLVREFEPQFIQVGLRLLDAAERIAAAGHAMRAEHGCRGTRRRYRGIAVQLLGKLVAAAHGDRQIGLGLLGRIRFGLQLREIAALLARHEADIFLLERGQLVLGRAQALFVILDLRFEKLLRMFRTLALAAQGLLHEGGQQSLDHVQRAIAAGIGVMEAVDGARGAAFVALRARAVDGQGDAVAQEFQDSARLRASVTVSGKTPVSLAICSNCGPSSKDWRT